MGLKGAIVDVEVDVRNTGLPNFDIVGLPDAAVREARERVVFALRNSGFEFPQHRVVVNLAPADLRKEGSMYDLPLALGILHSSGQVVIKEADNLLCLGELSLDGQLRRVNGVLTMAISARQEGFSRLLVPWGNYQEATLVEGLEVYAFLHLQDVIAYLKGATVPQPESLDPSREPEDYHYDFAHIKGQVGAKRALEVAAAGGHNLLMVGSPGAGKTLLARSLSTILPQLSFAEMLQITQIHSVAGLLPSRDALIRERPFRSPHHSISSAGLVGGGSVPRPGEISLAHYGVLFLDELPEFRRDILELLRQPLEDRLVTISRVHASYTFPAGFMLVASMNPCPCGYLGDAVRSCTCSVTEVRRYRRRISGPLLDRIDIQIDIPRLSYEELAASGSEELSATIRQRVDQARHRQRERLGADACNAQMPGREVRTICRLNAPARALMRASFEQLHLTARAHDRILKVARTIADLEGSEDITPHHLAEAISYRNLDHSSVAS
ncbi:MAG: YifB family Mg chelatase-like AAA ATPase [Symbiobacteriaceae bacterium]|nr:YifB family Mg chelatase-like AAA ATPase [Symbiobacteriaceae bacterium]